jgi:hypothetical protein
MRLTRLPWGFAPPQAIVAPETGLKSVFQQVKAAVASQFGRRSSEYAMVAGIRY